MGPVSVIAHHADEIDTVTLMDSHGSEVVSEFAPGTYANKVIANIIEELWWFLLKRYDEKRSEWAHVRSVVGRNDCQSKKDWPG